MNIGMILKWGSIFMGMVQDPNIHMIGRGAWAGIKRLRTAMDPSRPASSASSVSNANRSALNQRGLKGHPGTPNVRQLPAAPGMGRMPSEAEMRRMMEEMGIQPYLSPF